MRKMAMFAHGCVLLAFFNVLVSFTAVAEEYVVESVYDQELGYCVGNVHQLTNYIVTAKNKDVITLSNGVYDVSFLVDSPMYGSDKNSGYGLGLLSVKGKSLTIKGFTGNPEDVIIDGKGSFRVFAINNDDAWLRDLTIKGGYVGATCAPYNYRTGGGVLFANNASISNCIITSCRAERGGGGAAGPYDTVRGSIYDCRFDSNTSDASGGAIRCCRLVSGCTVVSNIANGGNSSHGGGGIAVVTTVTNCLVAYNYSKCMGGGLYECQNVIGTTVMRNASSYSPTNPTREPGGAWGGSYRKCVFKDNYAASVVKAISMEDCTVEDGRIHCLTNINCVFRNISNDPNRIWAVGNVKYPEGITCQTIYAFCNVELMRGCEITKCQWHLNSGALINCVLFYSVNGIVENCTITGNAYHYFAGNLNNGAVFRNCAIVNNTSIDKLNPGDISIFDSDKYSFSNCVWNVLGRHVEVERDPAYVDVDCISLGKGVSAKFTGKGEFPLTPKLTSPLVGAGKVCDWMQESLDLAGNPRLRDGFVDVGAYQCHLVPAGMKVILK